MAFLSVLHRWRDKVLVGSYFMQSIAWEACSTLPAPIQLDMDGCRGAICIAGKQNPTNIHPTFGDQINAVEACEFSA